VCYFSGFYIVSNTGYEHQKLGPKITVKTGLIRLLLTSLIRLISNSTGEYLFSGIYWHSLLLSVLSCTRLEHLTFKFLIFLIFLLFELLILFSSLHGFTLWSLQHTNRHILFTFVSYLSFLILLWPVHRDFTDAADEVHLLSCHMTIFPLIYPRLSIAHSRASHRVDYFGTIYTDVIDCHYVLLFLFISCLISCPYSHKSTGLIV